MPFDILPKTYFLAFINLSTILTLLLLNGVSFWSLAFPGLHTYGKLKLARKTKYSINFHSINPV